MKNIITFILNIFRKKNNSELNKGNTFKSESVETIDSFLIRNENIKKEIKFNSISEINLMKDWTLVHTSPSAQSEMKSFLSKLVGAGANIGIASQMTSGLFKASTNPETLMKLSSGGLGSAITSGGQITGQAGFISAGSTLFTPLIIFQITSIVTGQYYLNNITKQLNSIQKKLDELLSLFHIERKAKLKKSFIILNEYAKRNVFEVEDFILLKNILSDLLDIREEYSLMLEEIISEVDFSSDSFSSYKQAKEVITNFEETGFFYKLSSSLMADELYHLGLMVQFHMNLCYKEPNINRINLISHYLDRIKNFSEDNFMFTKTSKMYNKIKKDVLSQIRLAKKESWFYDDEIAEIESSIKKDFTNFEKNKKKGTQRIKNNYSQIIQPFNSNSEILIDNTNGDSLLYFKNNLD